MIAILDDSLFQGQLSDVSLIGLLVFLSSSRHLFDVNDAIGSPYSIWSQQQSPRVQQDLLGILVGSRAQLSQPIQRTSIIRISHQAGDNWAPATPNLCFATALEYLQLPFSIFVENSRSDRAFMEAFMLPGERQWFREKVGRGWIELRHSGGISELRKQIEAEVGARTGVKLRSYALFDGDAMYPSEPSADAERAKDVCNAHAMNHIQLSRRAIENYLPYSALLRWCSRSGSLSKVRSATHRAYQRMTAQQKAHFGMKAGFDGDAANAGRAKNLYVGLDAIQRAALKIGFGAKAWTNFSKPQLVIQRELVSEGSWGEVRPAITKMLQMI